MSTETELLTEGPRRASHTVVLAHGAGAAMDTEFMNAFTAGLVEEKLRVVRFEFPYMAQRRTAGKRRPPDREPVLRETWHNVLNSLGGGQLVIGGKSMGGRIASLIADEAEVAGLVCLGYPFHPMGKPDKLRVEHLTAIKTPTLILQGERDPMGNKDEVVTFKLAQNVKVRWLPDGDHSFKPRKKSGRTEDQNWRDGIEAIAQFIRSLKG